MQSKIVVIGSSNVDFIMTMPRLPKLGETITDGVFTQTYGGKGANQAVAAARAGAQVTFVTCLGDDDFADKIIANFTKDGMNTQFIEKAARVSTGTALVMIGEGGNNYLSVAPGSNFKLSIDQIDKAQEAIKEADMLIMQLEVSNESNYYLLDLAEKLDKKVLMNYAPPQFFDRKYLRIVEILVVNETEAEFITGFKVETNVEIEMASEKLYALCPNTVIITLGSKGCYVKRGSEKFFSEGFKVKAVDATAAGDTFCGVLAVGITEGKSIKDAVKFAQAAAALAVTKLGAQPSIPVRLEIDTLNS
jgi:ribokinase